MQFNLRYIPRIVVAFGVFLALLASAHAADPLPSWNEGPTKQAILGFVADVTDGDTYIIFIGESRFEIPGAVMTGG